MAASKDKAQALKNSYVDGIISELGGQSDPAVRMAVRENDIASVHAFPEQGKMGAINDGDPSFYVHGGQKGDSYKIDEKPSYANPVGEGQGGRLLMDGTEKDIKDTQYFLDKERGRMGGTGDLVRGGFDASNLAGAMGMEQGKTAGAVFDLENGILIRKNDGNPRLVIRDGSMRSVQADYANAANPLNAGYGAEDVTRLHPRDMAVFARELHSGGNNVDTTVYDGLRQVGKQYKEQMYQNYTR